MVTEEIGIPERGSTREAIVVPVDVRPLASFPPDHSQTSPTTLFQALRSRLGSGVTVSVGYLLSPLSPWNDAWLNIPIAYVVARGVVFIDKDLFLPSFIAAYWVTNLLGLQLMHMGGSRLVPGLRGRRTYVLWAGASLAYTMVIVALAQLTPIKP